jgi:hypothetical protein
VISACALIAFQSAKATGASKLATRPMCALFGTSRNRPVPTRSSTTTWVICAAMSVAPPESGTKPGAANGIGSITPSVISMRSGACAAAANGRSASAAGTPINRFRRRRSTMTPSPRG